MTSQLVLDHLVDRLHQLARGGHVVFRHALDLVHHLLAHVLGHLALQLVQQVLELLLGLGVHEVVLQQFLDLASGAFGQSIQLLLVVVGALLQQVQQVFLLGLVVAFVVLDLL